MPSATFSHTVQTDASAEAAWAALQDPNTWLSIGPVSSVSNPVLRPDGTLAGFDWVADVGGKGYDGKAVGGDYEAPHRFTMTMDTSEIAGDVIASISESDETVEVAVQITFRTKGMLSSMFFPAIRTALSSGFPRQIEDLVASI